MLDCKIEWMSIRDISAILKEGAEPEEDISEESDDD